MTNKYFDEEYKRLVRNANIAYGLFLAGVFLTGIAFGMLIEAAS